MSDLLEFPELGSPQTLSLFPESNDVLRAGVKIVVRLVGAGVARNWAMAFEKNRLDEVQRLATLRKGLSREEAPELWAEEVCTPEGHTESATLARRILSECLKSVHGVSIGGKDISEECDVETLVAHLEGCGLIDAALGPAVQAQNPTREQVFN